LCLLNALKIIRQHLYLVCIILLLGWIDAAYSYPRQKLTNTPTITTANGTGGILACQGTPSVAPHVQQFTVTGTYLTAPIVVTAPANFEVSLAPSGSYSASLTLSPASGAVGPLTIYVRSSASAPAGNPSGRVALASTGAAEQQVGVFATIYGLPLANNITNITLVAGSQSSKIVFTGTGAAYSWTNNNTAIGLAANGTGDINSFTAINPGRIPITATIKITPLNSESCEGHTQTFTITVNPTPLLTVTGSLNSMTTIYGTPSASESFTLSGSYLTSGVMVTPPAGFEISTDGNTFSGTANIAANGNATTATIYIRLAAATPAGAYGGEINLSSSGASEAQLLMPTSTVDPAGLTVSANNQTRLLDTPNPPLTLSYAGFVNGDTPDQLTTAPTATTTAVTTSPTGQYPITVSGGVSPNYTFHYINGVLSILPPFSPKDIPNTFTPNGDGINDTWDIKILAFYPNVTVNIFNRSGQKLYSSIGYSVPWDGTYQGKALPMATYYYVITPQNGQQPIAGWVAIVR
jgi:gliding motility-associated-like protein